MGLAVESRVGSRIWWDRAKHHVCFPACERQGRQLHKTDARFGHIGARCWASRRASKPPQNVWWCPSPKTRTPRQCWARRPCPLAAPRTPPSTLESLFFGGGGQEAGPSRRTSTLPEPRREPGLAPLMWAGRDVDVSALASHASRSAERKTNGRKTDNYFCRAAWAFLSFQ